MSSSRATTVTVRHAAGLQAWRQVLFFWGVSCDMVQWWVQVDAYLALLVLGHHDAYPKQELTSVGVLWQAIPILGKVVMWQAMGSGGYSHGSPSTEPPLMHTTRESSWAWGQVLGLVVPGFRGLAVTWHSNGFKWGLTWLSQCCYLVS